MIQHNSRLALDRADARPIESTVVVLRPARQLEPAERQEIPSPSSVTIRAIRGQRLLSRMGTDGALWSLFRKVQVIQHAVVDPAVLGKAAAWATIAGHLGTDEAKQVAESLQ